MKIDQNKFNRQKEGFQKWKANNCRGTFEWVTGVGKTFAAILCAKYYIKKDSNFIVYVVVPTDTLRDDWRKEVVTHGIADNFVINTVHSHVKKESKCDMLILDEIHRYLGDEAEIFPLIFKKIIADKILGLTATLGHDGIRRSLVDNYCPVIDIIDLKEALENGYVSDYIKYNLGIELTQKERVEYAKLNNEFYNHFSKFDMDFDLVKECLNPDKYDSAEQHSRNTGLPKGVVIGLARKCMAATRKRKEYLYSAPSKIEMAKEIVEFFPDKKYITFAQTTEAPDKLSDVLDCGMSFHSNIQTQLVDNDENVIGRKSGKGKYILKGKNGEFSWDQIKEETDGNVTRLGKKRIKKFVLDKFRSGEIRGLHTARALDVGFDDANIELGIILSFTSKSRQLIQRIGRTIRKKEGKRALIFHLYIKDTQDEKWLNDSETNASNVKNITSLSQIQIDNDKHL